MDRYHNFTAEEFLWDESFRNWVLRPTREDDARWRNWIAENPDKESVILRAKGLVLGISPGVVALPDAEKQNAIRKILSQLSEPSEEAEQIDVLRFYQKNWFRLAAAILLVIGLAWGMWGRHTDKSRVNYEQLVATSADVLTEKVNHTDKPFLVTLQDGSTVLLNPQSKISYPAKFGSDKREVYLSGEAFFDIAKDPSKPFFVYANEVVTKVLGTSFFVRSYTNEKEVSVSVKTGRVAVFARTDPGIENKQNSKELTGVVIEPNQQIVFVRETVKITKSLISKPELVAEKDNHYNFDFDETPVSAVFSVLQNAYGIEIIYDKNIMSECPITATLTELSLFEKLDLICKAVGAEYELIDGRIIIEGKGCKMQ
ncbi:hypothetical protein DYBT9275_00527 [Dyadobacter sp. CECT 9275]|uniref:FecR family protein n=1 Tax=Dyadobacter helix TaxID=2822344 RepID=A0A916J7M1_9BACT|nr:FecR family protein [Dyadobacter sp. CECT 9275]CAG4990430.1 hypothetical protein DYBT9275_00527 [Dyadobacter sp. CECT 9275]